MYWEVLRQFIATYALTAILIFYPGLGLALGQNYTDMQYVLLWQHKGLSAREFIVICWCRSLTRIYARGLQLATRGPNLARDGQTTSPPCSA